MDSVLSQKTFFVSSFAPWPSGVSPNELEKSTPEVFRENMFCVVPFVFEVSRELEMSEDRLRKGFGVYF